ncbi:hypothetical protein Hypma_016288 [Hypsizygus marmoreus]|uniref:Uncharacterized protein n=1 Tax=Hypsizygus marmoreus TaxID=39966 RepID=A0A369J6U9_HYPMA|nr:hypothetical protein Hypma_016288 [Hypsizygus marmoreus]
MGPVQPRTPRDSGFYGIADRMVSCVQRNIYAIPTFCHLLPFQYIRSENRSPPTISLIRSHQEPADEEPVHSNAHLHLTGASLRCYLTSSGPEVRRARRRRLCTAVSVHHSVGPVAPKFSVRYGRTQCCSKRTSNLCNRVVLLNFAPPFIPHAAPVDPSNLTTTSILSPSITPSSLSSLRLGTNISDAAD